MALLSASLVVLAVVAASAAIRNPSSRRTPEPTEREPAALPSASPTPQAFPNVPAGWPKPPENAQEALVAAVTDGDTIVLRGIEVGAIDSRTGGRKTRLIGIDTPEVFGGAECYGAQASDFTKRELDGESVLVDFDVQQTDRFGRALAYVWKTDGRLFNARLAADGYAQQLTIPPNVRYAELFTKLVREAREANRGLWAGCPALPAATAAAAPVVDRDCPDFATQPEAQSFFEAQGGPAQDPHRLDADDDGIACEGLPGNAPAATTAAPTITPAPPTPSPTPANCHPSYPDFCIAPPPPDVDCPQIGQKDFTVKHDVTDPDPHGFDADKDGIGCES